MMLEVEKLFRRTFQCPPTYSIRVPGSVEMMGSLADWSQGLALAAALTSTVDVAVASRFDGRIQLATDRCPQSPSFWISDLDMPTEDADERMLRRVLLLLRRRGVHFNGFNIALTSPRWVGAGLGFGAAALLVMALAVRQMHPYRLTDTGILRPPQRDPRGRLPPLGSKEKHSLANLCAEAGKELQPLETRLHFLAPLFAKAWHAVAYDALHESVHLVPTSGTVALVVSDPRQSSDPSGLAYDGLRSKLSAAANELRLKSLRHADAEVLQRGQGALSDAAYCAAIHFVGENRRVVAGEHALEDHDWHQFALLLRESHASARDFLGAQSAEMECLANVAARIPGVIASRAVGAGFESPVVHWILMTAFQRFEQELRQAYFQAAGRHIPVLASLLGGAVV